MVVCLVLTNLTLCRACEDLASSRWEIAAPGFQTFSTISDWSYHDACPETLRTVGGNFVIAATRSIQTRLNAPQNDPMHPQLLVGQVMGDLMICRAGYYPVKSISKSLSHTKIEEIIFY